MLVHSFSPEAEGLDDYLAFVQAPGASGKKNLVTSVGKRAGINLSLGWASGEAKWLEA